MAYKKINGIEVIERGESTVSVAWLMSKSEGEAVRGRSGVDRNNTVAMWKEVHGYSIPNYVSEEASRKDELMKLKKTELSELADSMEVEYESDANKATIADLIIETEEAN